MNKLSITLRITLWYSLLMLLLVLLVLGFMVGISDSIIKSNAESRLVSTIDYNAEEVEYDDGELEVDKDDFDYYKNGVSSLVYTADFTLAAGQLPAGFPADTAFADGAVQQVTSSGGQYLVYDRMVTFKKHPEVWVRGVLPLDAVSGIAGSILQVALFALPLLAVLAAVGGYIITRRAFHPVRVINQAVESITEGKDLSRRIVMKEGKDEIHALADTFNGMLERLESAFEAEKQFVSDVSHELRTPVSVILAQCEYALSQEPATGESTDALQVVQRQAGRMHRLIAHLLTITRLEQGNFQVTLHETDVSALCQTLLEETAVLMPEHMTLRQDIPESITAAIDPALFTRLFQNLMQNAMKYGSQSVAVTLRAQSGRIALEVTDDGPGIAPSEQEKIFHRFYQVNPSRTADEAESMGLGLSIVRQIAHLHHGEVTVQSEPGKGSVFIFTFPQK